MSGNRVTMQRVAEAAGVSRTTVSFVLNHKREQLIPGSTRERVLRAARELGYERAHTQVPNSVGLVVRRSLDEIAQAAFLIEVLRGVTATLDQVGYHVRLCELSDREDFDYEHWLSNRSDAGLILFNVLVSERDRLTRLTSDEALPIVTIHPSGASNVPSVGIDNVAAAFDAVNHLISLGHSHVAMISYAPPHHVVSLHRQMGYRQALEHHGIAYDERWIAHGNFTSESGYEAMTALLSRVPVPPTAVFVLSDVVAVGAIQAARELGWRVPEDISFVGFDDVPLCRYLAPALTTMSQPGIEIGRHAGETLLKLMRGETLVPSILLPAQLVTRESACPPQMDELENNRSLREEAT